MEFSVLISVYKGEKPEHFKRAFTSIWDDQTLKPKEIVLVEDGPLTSDLYDVVEKMKQRLREVVKVIRLEQNKGLAVALNKGLKHCSYNLVARMDTDDISLPNRFERQVSFMEKNPAVAVSSAWIEEIGEREKTVSIRKLPLTHKAIKRFAKSRNPISHPVSIFRKDKVLSVGGYPNIRKNQDYGLWSLLIVKGYKLANLPEILLKMRVNNNFLKRRGYNYLKYEVKLMRRQLQMGLFGWPTFLKNLTIRSILRLSPNSLKSFFYKYARG